MIEEYFNKISDIINHFAVSEKTIIEKIKLDDFSGVIKGRLYFKTAFLEFLEVISLKNNPNEKKKKYKDHLKSITQI